MLTWRHLQAEDCFPYESQSEAEFDEMFLVVARSHRHIHSVEDRVTEYLSQGFVNTATTTTTTHLQEYVSYKSRERVVSYLECQAEY